MEAKASNQEQQQPTHVVCKVDLFNEIMKYISTRPYNEVAELVEKIKGNVQLLNMPEQEEQQEEEPEPKTKRTKTKKE